MRSLSSLVSATIKKLGFEELKVGEKVAVVLQSKEQTPPRKVARMATIDVLLVLARHDVVIQYMGQESSLFALVNEDFLMPMGKAVSDALQRVGDSLGRAPLSAVARPYWMTADQLAKLAAIPAPPPKQRLQLIHATSAYLGTDTYACNVSNSTGRAWQFKFCGICI